MTQKRLQPESTYNTLDLDGDGVVSDNELAAAEALEKHEKADAQRRMAWISLISMLIFTAMVFLPVFPDSRITVANTNFIQTTLFGHCLYLRSEYIYLVLIYRA